MEKKEACRPKLVYHYIQWKNLEPDFVVDITGFIDQKCNRLAYGSQFLILILTSLKHQ